MKNNSFGENLRALRKQKNLSQDDLGKVLGFCNQTVSFWENGCREPDLDTLVKISDFFNISIDELVKPIA